MATRKTIKAVNWSGIVERLSEVDKPSFAVFRTKSDGYLRRMQEFPETTPAIDWAYYKKHIAVAGMVDRFQKEFDSLKIPYPADTYTSTVEKQESEVKEYIKEFITGSNQRIAEATAEIAKINAMIPFDNMTMEDYAEAYPDQAFNPDKPTIWPHFPEIQPGEEPEPMPNSLDSH